MIKLQAITCTSSPDLNKIDGSLLHMKNKVGGRRGTYRLFVKTSGYYMYLDTSI